MTVLPAPVRLVTPGIHWSEQLVELDSCEEGIAWAKNVPDALTGWKTSVRGDWLLWLAGRLALDDEARKEVIHTACRAALTAIPLTEMASDSMRLLAHVEGRLHGHSTLNLHNAIVAAQRIPKDHKNYNTAGAALSCAALLRSLSRAFTNDPRWQVEWAKAASRPAGWVAAAKSTAVFEQLRYEGVDEPTAKQNAARTATRALASLADLIRSRLPGDKILRPMLPFHA